MFCPTHRPGLVSDLKSELLEDKIKSFWTLIHHERKDYVLDYGHPTRDIRKSLRNEQKALVSSVAFQVCGDWISTYSLVQVYMFEGGYWCETISVSGTQETATIVVNDKAIVVRELPVVDDDGSSV